MGRKREQSLLEDVFDLLKLTPFWVGPLLAVIVYFGIRDGIPMLMPDKTNGIDPGTFLRPMIPMFAWLFTAIIVLGWLMAEGHKLWSRRLLDKQEGIESIRKISWSQFEHLVCEAYRRKGYLAEVVGSPAGDGGVDIVLTARNERFFVQCKQWKAFKVGVKPVRELLGVVVSEKANRGILVTSGRFTNEAIRFARSNPVIDLVDGEQLAVLVLSAQGKEAVSSPKPITMGGANPSCPRCGSRMVLRTAKSGANIGNQFWGCSRFPTCRGILERN